MKKFRIILLILLTTVLVSNMALTSFALTGEWGSVVDKKGNGDVNNDQKVDEVDLEMIKNHIVGMAVLSDSQLKRADADKNGKVDIRDYNLIYAKIQSDLSN